MTPKLPLKTTKTCRKATFIRWGVEWYGEHQTLLVLQRSTVQILELPSLFFLSIFSQKIRNHLTKKVCHHVFSSHLECGEHIKLSGSNFKAREGVIIECPPNDLFHNVVADILMSQMVVS